VPFLRVVRDKRGYETTYLMHWYREGARQRSRILYMFRTPGGVRVGRDPFDLQVRRELEAHYPDIAFEWDVVRENQQVVEPLEQRRRRPRREEEAVAPPAPVPVPEPVAQGAAPPARPPIPSAIEGTTADEQIAFLVSWYPLVRERLQLRTPDPARLEALLALCERLNPTDWTDADHIATGLQQAAEALERLSHLLSRRRRRSRRKGARPGDAPSSGVDATMSDQTSDAMEAADGAESNDDTDSFEPHQS
jgi:hypothetical protein